MDIMSDFNLQAALTAITARVDDADREAQEAKNRELAAAISNGTARERVMRAIEAEKAVSAQILMLTQEPESELKHQRLVVAVNRLAEVIAEQGRYGEAAEIVADDAKREEYERLNGALQMPDDQKCSCPEQLLKIAEIGRPGSNATKGVYRCPTCGFENIR